MVFNCSFCGQWSKVDVADAFIKVAESENAETTSGGSCINVNTNLLEPETAR